MTENIKKNNNISKKSLARLIACQALCMYYDVNNEDKNISNILNTININFIKNIFFGKEYQNVYMNKFVYSLINGVIENYKEYDVLINKTLDKQDTVETLEEILLQVFRLAIFELKNFNIDKKVVINEYVDIVGEFYNNVYVNFANGVIDSMATAIKCENKKNKLIQNQDFTKKELLNIEKKKSKKREIIKLKNNKNKY